MTTTLTPLTELEAINDMLSMIAETPLASLDEVDGVADAQIARQLLNRVSRNVQEEDWDWNTEHDFPLSPDTDGNIVLPSNTLSVDPTDQSLDYVSRAGKLWDRGSKSFNINATINVTIRLYLAFEDLPSTARRYIAAVAGRMFENRMIGDGTAHQINESDVLRARVLLLEEEAENANLNVIKDSPSSAFRTRYREVR